MHAADTNCLLTHTRGWSFDGAIWTDEVIPKDNKYATKYVPQTRAFIVSNDKAVVLVFRGAHALFAVSFHNTCVMLFAHF
jgi:hypothetical protein